MPKRLTENLIFLVEDEVSQRLLYRFCLENEGFPVLDFANGEDALKALVRHRPRVICLDFNLPQMSGLEMVSAIRTRAADAAILLISAADDQSTLDQIATAKVDGHLAKPVQQPELVHEVLRILRYQQRLESSVPD